MQVARAVGAASLLLCAASASAQEAVREQGDDRFFYDELEADESLDETGYDGSLTATTLFHKETGDKGSAAVQGGAFQPNNVSPTARFFTDLRLQFEADHISGGRWDFRTDLRGRFVPESCRDARAEGELNAQPCDRFQSGTFSGHELELRELYVRRGGDTVDWTIGRQFVLEVAATKFDGIKYERGAGDWRLIAFGGGYPQRISRDIRDDYPAPAGGRMGSRALALTGGGAAAYRFEQYYGAFGAAVVAPMAKLANGDREAPRVLVTSNGYWRINSHFDVYHFLVADAMGDAGPGVTNLNVGVNYHPSSGFRTYLQATRTDTDTLAITAQTRLEGAGTQVNAIQNNIEVSRLASESIRAGVSTSLAQNRFELSTAVTIRRRPGLTLVDNGAAPATQTIAPAEATDITIQAVDRKSLGGFRLAATVYRSFGTTLIGGERNFDRGNTLSLRFDARRDFMNGRVELEATGAYVASNDETRADACNPGQIETCYGTAATSALQGGGTLYYRFDKDWFLVGGGNVTLNSLSVVVDNGQTPVDQPGSLLTTLFARVAYKF